MEQCERCVKVKKWVVWVLFRGMVDEYYCRNIGLLLFGDFEEILEEEVIVKKKLMIR